MTELLEKYDINEDQYVNVSDHFHALIMAVKIEREITTNTEGEIRIEVRPERGDVDNILSDVFDTLKECGIRIEMQ